MWSIFTNESIYVITLATYPDSGVYQIGCKWAAMQHAPKCIFDLVDICSSATPRHERWRCRFSLFDSKLERMPSTADVI